MIWVCPFAPATVGKQIMNIANLEKGLTTGNIGPSQGCNSKKETSQATTNVLLGQTMPCGPGRLVELVHVVLKLLKQLCRTA